MQAQSKLFSTIKQVLSYKKTHILLKKSYFNYVLSKKKINDWILCQ